MITALQQPPFWHHDAFGMGWHWGWWLFWLVIAVLLIWVVAATRSRDGSGDGQGGDRTRGDAKEALRRRFAEGELSEGEFREKLRVLRESE